MDGSDSARGSLRSQWSHALVPTQAQGMLTSSLLAANGHTPPATGAYIDDTAAQVCLNSLVGNPSVLFDLDRVEFLEGPQGALFGAGERSEGA